jgi:hypothetical protein
MNILDAGSAAVAAITLALFLAALYLRGLSHEILLEAGVFLVSVKLMMMMRKNEAYAEKLDAKLDALAAALKKPGA